MRDRFDYLNGIHFRFRPPTGSAPVLVFANSLGTDLRIWEPLIQRLPARWGLLRCDMRGHGLSALSVDAFTIDDLADDLAGLISGCDIADFIGVGVSVGGMVMQRIAARNCGMIAAVLMDTAPKIGTWESWDERVKTVRRDGMDSIADTIMQRWFRADFISSDPAYPMWRSMLQRNTAEGYVALCRAIQDADFTADLGRIDIPVLVLAGLDDGSTPPELVEQMAAGIRGAEFVEIDAAGHLPGIEQPAHTAREISRFVRQLRSV